jgi:hypothetical protein
MGASLAILMKKKVTDDRHPCLAPWYKILASKAASHNQLGDCPVMERELQVL